MENKFTHVIGYLHGTPWAILPEKLTAILNFISMKADGMTFTKEEIDGRFGALARPSVRTQGAVAVIPVFGTIGQRMNLISDFSGGTSTEKLSKQIISAADDPNIKAIVLDVDSPGGTVGGVPELSKVIFEARKKKHIVAVSNSLMASAAYWIGTAADEVVVTPSGEVGSIGVFTIHQDISEMAEQAGVKFTLISAGKFKTEGNPYQPLGEDAKDSIQADVDQFFNMFVADVARNRGVSVAVVKSGFGQGRVLSAKDALKAGMVDRIATLDETLARLGVIVIGDTMKIKVAAHSVEKISEVVLSGNENESSTRDLEKATAEPKELDYELERKKLDLVTI